MSTRNPGTVRIVLNTLLIIAAAGLAGLSACSGKPEAKELYHRFPDGNWPRFNILSFEIPVTEAGKTCDLYLFATFTKNFRYETLNFNMVMNTAAGEERIKEYEMAVRGRTGAFNGECRGDSCRVTMLLKKELLPGKPGILKLEIENLTPRLNTEGVAGVGIRLVSSGK
jgi:gliding motility-associated lipoprotein GldH